MEVLATLKREHGQIRSLLNELAAGEDLSQRECADLLAELRELLQAHNQAEEVVLYAPLLASESTRDLAIRAQRAHAEIEALTTALDCERDEDRWRETLEELRKVAERHIEEEESAIFDAIRKMVAEHPISMSAIEPEPIGETAR